MKEMETWLRQIRIAGIPDKVFDICIKNGIFQKIREVEDQKEITEKLWITPGLIDLHFHGGWTDFDHSVQEKRTPEEVKSMIQIEMQRLLESGVTMIRDAGGLKEQDWKDISDGSQKEDFPEVVLCADMLHVEENFDWNRLQPVLESKNAWVKIFAAGGISTDIKKVLEPNISEAGFKKLVKELKKNGKKVMVHTWGGPVLDWLIDAEADSVEHGIFMTREQARRLAQNHIPYVATTRIYQMIAAGKEPLVLPEFLRERAKEACKAHRQAVQYALEEGVEIGFGTDFYSGDNLIPNELEELFSLQEYGLSAEQAWKGATETAAKILGLGDSYGKIAEGYVANAVLFRENPYQAKNAEELKKSIVRVLRTSGVNN